MGRCKARLCPSRPVRRTRALPGTIPQAAVTGQLVSAIDTREARQSVGTESAGRSIMGERHPVLAGFDDTDILTFGGALEELRTEPGVIVPLTFVPSFPAFPPEMAWMRQPTTNIPALVINSKIAYLPADIDSRYARYNLPDQIGRASCR